jgi:nucleoside-diphosphate-sugar epimerase
MKLAITGASGFIGGHFLARHRSNYEQVSVLSRKAASNSVRLRTINGSLSNANACRELTKNADAVLHCAFDGTYRENLSGMAHLLECCRNSSVQRLIHLSSYVVYDFRTPTIDETSPFSHRKDLYTREKIRLEEMLQSAADSACSILAMQPTVVFGPGSSWSDLMLQAAKHNIVKMPNRGRNPCNAIYIDDLVDLLHEQLQTPNASPFKAQIANNIHTTWREFMQFHADILRQKLLPVNKYQVDSSNQLMYAESKLKDFIFKNSGAFPWRQLLAPLIRKNRDRANRLRLDSPLVESPFVFTGTARMCQAFSHQVHSLSPTPTKQLKDWLDHFASCLN